VTAVPTRELFGGAGGVVFDDANRSGVAEASEAASVGLTVFHDRDGDGRLDDGEAYDLTEAGGVFRLVFLPAGPQTICLDLAVNRLPTTGRCQVASVPLSGQANDLTFGHVARPSNCAAGAVVATIRSIDPAGGDERYYRPLDLTRAATGAPWTGRRLAFRGSNPITYIQQGEGIVTGLYASGVNPAQHPNLTLRHRYQRSYQQVVAVVAADGRPARSLGSGPALPTPPPAGDFAYFDQNGDLYIYNLPERAGDHEEVFVVTRATAAGGTLTVTASVGGKIANGRLTTISNTCPDVAGSILFTGATTVVAGAAPVDDAPDGAAAPNPF
jgi:hypothetical protein